MHRCMYGCVYGCMGVCMGECMNVHVYVCIRKNYVCFIHFDTTPHSITFNGVF